MDPTPAPARGFSYPACWAAMLCAAAGVAEARGGADEPYRNLSAGGPLRHGVYGRIAVAGETPPPVIFAEPVVARRGIGPVRAQPAYLYVPAGHVRKWRRHCAKWQACREPVFFIRMEGGPGRWGQWRALREGVAGNGAEP